MVNKEKGESRNGDRKVKEWVTRDERSMEYEHLKKMMGQRRFKNEIKRGMENSIKNEFAKLTKRVKHD